MERSSRVLSGALLRCSILPPTCSRNVRSVVSTTRAAGSASIAARISSQCSGPRASTVMSRSVWWSSTLTRSTEPIVPPASPIALATSPSIPGLCSISTRMVREYWADGVAATQLTLPAADFAGDRESGGVQRVEHRVLGGAAEQPAGEQRAVGQQVVECAVDVAVAQGRLAHQLADERAADALGARDDRVAPSVVDVEAARVEVDEPRPRGG